MTNVETLRKLLLEKNIKPSFPRLKVMEYLILKRNHPTVDDIYRELAGVIPTLSKTTVYNTVTLFVEANLVRRVATEENEARYDACVEDHGHFKCDACGKIFDFAIRFEPLLDEELSSFDVHERNIYYRGLCSHCRGKGKHR